MGRLCAALIACYSSRRGANPCCPARSTSGECWSPKVVLIATTTDSWTSSRVAFDFGFVTDPRLGERKAIPEALSR